MKFIKCHLDNQGTVIIKDHTEVEKDFDAVDNEVRNSSKFSGYLFYPGDKPGIGCPVDPQISREEYLNNPAKYGVCIYKTHGNRVCYE